MKQLFYSTEQRLADTVLIDKQGGEQFVPKSWMEATSSFSYTSREMFVHGHTTYVKRQHFQWQNGRLSSEEFEATIPDRVFDEAERTNRLNTQNPVGAVISGFASLFALFLNAKNK